MNRRHLFKLLLAAPVAALLAPKLLKPALPKVTFVDLPPLYDPTILETPRVLKFEMITEYGGSKVATYYEIPMPTTQWTVCSEDFSRGLLPDRNTTAG